MREKDYGIWQSWSWAEVAKEVEELAGGLKRLDFRRGDKVAIIGDNRPRLYWAIAATQALGGVPVPFYQDLIADEMAYVLEHAEVRWAIIEDQEQVDKLVAVKERCPHLETVIYSNPRGLRHYGQPYLHSYDRVREEGRAFARTNPAIFRNRDFARPRLRYRDHPLHLGHDRPPKGVVLSFENLIATGRAAIAFEGLTDREEVLAYLPMAWIGEHIFSYVQAYCAGFCVSCPESGATVMADLRELGPTYLFAPPSIFEDILTRVMIRMEDAAWVKQRLFHHFIDIAKRVGPALLDGKPARLARPSGLLARQPAGLRTAEERARHDPSPGRLHGRRGDRTRPVPVLPLARDQPEAALRHDRELGLSVYPEGWSGEA